MEIRTIKLSELQLNTGQIEGLPKNPRLISESKLEKLCKSIEEHPDMMQIREIVAYDSQAGLVVIMGNMRLQALQKLGVEEATVKVIPRDTEIEHLKAYVIKDNANYGDWDWDLINEEWDSEEIEEWGVECDNYSFDTNLFGDDDAREIGNKVNDDKQYFSVTFAFATEHKELVNGFIKEQGKEYLTTKILELCQNAEVK